MSLSSKRGCVKNKCCAYFTAWIFLYLYSAKSASAHECHPDHAL